MNEIRAQGTGDRGQELRRGAIYCALRPAPCALILALLVAGCGLLKRVPNQFYALDTFPAEGARAAKVGAPIGLDTVELPPGIDRRELVVRGADNKLEVRGQHQWASPIEEMVVHTLAFDLANRLPEGMIVLPGQPRPTGTRSLSVTFEDLAPGPNNVFVLDARWTLADVTHHERIEVPLASTESTALVAAMSRALATLADRIVAGI
jgi:uncharacterized protein